jgi:hypothetical protein
MKLLDWTKPKTFPKLIALTLYRLVCAVMLSVFVYLYLQPVMIETSRLILLLSVVSLSDLLVRFLIDLLTMKGSTNAG